MSAENKSLRIDMADLKHKFEDLVFKTQRMQVQKSNRDTDAENNKLRDSLVSLEKKLLESQTCIRKIEEENSKLLNDKKLLMSGKENFSPSQAKNFSSPLGQQNRIEELENYIEQLHT
jgi:hypothetical protein